QPVPGLGTWALAALALLMACAAGARPWRGAKVGG
ncbi:IPTL-CTERM sorting domain-containing protein, partial [Lampropedia puyangensis]